MTLFPCRRPWTERLHANVTRRINAPFYALPRWAMTLDVVAEIMKVPAMVRLRRLHKRLEDRLVRLRGKAERTRYRDEYGMSSTQE